ncbi:hypothetical protein CHMI_03713 [Cellulomonas hominis]|nr:hypothetical protein CHMI_03713 [Cellulomonas hominis]
MRGGRLVVAAAAVLVLAGCAGEPVLLDDSDFTGVTSTSQNEWGGGTPGPTWCSGIGSAQYAAGGSASSWLSFGDHGDAGAALIDRSSDSASAEYFVGKISEQATACADSEATTRGYSIELLTGLGEGELGWTTRTSDGEWGEYALIPLDEWRLLAVGFSTFEDEPPVDLDELIEHARDGAEQFPSDRG